MPAGLVGELLAERMTDLHGAPPPAQTLLHEPGQLGITGQFGPYRPPVGSRLRRSSRLLVAGLQPTSRAIVRTPRPRRCRSAIVTRSSSDRNQHEISGTGTLITDG